MELVLWDGVDAEVVHDLFLPEGYVSFSATQECGDIEVLI